MKIKHLNFTFFLIILLSFAVILTIRTMQKVSDSVTTYENSILKMQRTYKTKSVFFDINI